MSSGAKLSKKIKAENLEIKKEFLELKGYRIEVSENSFILFENEQDYLNLFYLEKVVFDFINNLLYNKDIDKEIRIYFRLTLIINYLYSLPKYRKIKIFYDARYENPFEIKFPFISCFEDLKKRYDYLKEIEFLVDESENYRVIYCDCYCDCNDCDCCCDCDFYCNDCDCDCDSDCVSDCDCIRDEVYYEGESLILKYHKLINLLYKRIDIEYYKGNQDKFEVYNTEKFHHRYYFPCFDMDFAMFDSD